MRLSTTCLALSLGFTTLSSASPLLRSRQDDTNATTTSDSVLKPETLAIVQATFDAIGLNGAVVAYTSPKGDGVLTLGNKSVDGDAITPDVCGPLIPSDQTSSLTFTKTHFALASNSKLFFATTLAWLAYKNTSLPDGSGIFTLDTPLKDFVPDFKMYDPNATEQITSRDFMCESGSRHRAPVTITDPLPQHTTPVCPLTTSPSKRTILRKTGWIELSISNQSKASERTLYTRMPTSPS